MWNIFKKKPCKHKLNYILNQWVAKDDTPMISFVCLDCGYKDYGHVYGDSENWEKYIECKNGIAQDKSKFL